MRILIIEDNRRISEFLIKGLEESGFTIVLAETGNEALSEIRTANFDLVLLDIMLPDIDGYEILQYMRFKRLRIPVLVLSALGEVDDKVKALDMGADDYLSKPFHFNELLARVNALLRRKQHYDGDVNGKTLICGNLTVDVEQHIVKHGDVVISLTHQEFMLLKLFMENQDKVLTRTQILSEVWGIYHNTSTNIVDVYISYLRNKTEANNEKRIETVKGRGYIMRSRD
ncbi:MAG: response regulator transcription factor [Marinifilaceae bacterium]